MCVVGGIVCLGLESNKKLNAHPAEVGRRNIYLFVLSCGSDRLSFSVSWVKIQTSRAQKPKKSSKTSGFISLSTVPPLKKKVYKRVLLLKARSPLK